MIEKIIFILNIYQILKDYNINYSQDLEGGDNIQLELNTQRPLAIRFYEDNLDIVSWENSEEQPEIIKSYKYDTAVFNEIDKFLFSVSNTGESINKLQALADKLNVLNNFNPKEGIPEELIQEAKDNNIIILYTASDDIAVFEGAISEELYYYEGQLNQLTKNPKIEAVYKSEWFFNTEAPHIKITMGKRKGILFFKQENFGLIFS